jgi:hypothetical protein
MSNTPGVDPEIEAAIADMDEHAVERGLRHDSTPVALAKFARLLGLLSTKAEKQTAANLKIQRNLIWLTVLIFVLTLAMLALQFVQVFRSR